MQGGIFSLLCIESASALQKAYASDHASAHNMQHTHTHADSTTATAIDLDDGGYFALSHLALYCQLPPISALPVYLFSFAHFEKIQQFYFVFNRVYIALN